VRVICLFHNTANWYIYFETIWQCSPLIAECVWLKIVDTVLTLTLITSKQPLYTQELYATKYILIFDIQFYLCVHYRLHPGVLLPSNFLSTAIYALWVRNDSALHQQNVNQSGSHRQTSQTLLQTSPVLPSKSRCYQAHLELSNVLSDSARAFSSASESTCSFEGEFNMLRDLTYRIVKFSSCSGLCAGLRET